MAKRPSVKRINKYARETALTGNSASTSPWGSWGKPKKKKKVVSKVKKAAKKIVRRKGTKKSGSVRGA